MTHLISAWLRSVLTEDGSGQALAEYGMLLALIAVACLAALTALGLAIAGQLGAITGSL